MTNIKDLLPIVQSDIGGTEVNAVNARNLHAFLENKDAFAHWIKDRISQFGFVENQDFSTFWENSQKGRPRKEYLVSTDMAKELAMVERNAKGKEARLYFLDCERKLKEVMNAPVLPNFMDPAEAAIAWAEQYRKTKALETKIKEDEPKVAYADLVDGKGKGEKIDLVAKRLDVKPHWLRQFMREKNWMRLDGAPMQWAKDCGYLTYKRWIIPHNSGVQEIKTTTYVTGKGEIRLAQLIAEQRINRPNSDLFNSNVA